MQITLFSGAGGIALIAIVFALLCLGSSVSYGQTAPLIKIIDSSIIKNVEDAPKDQDSVSTGSVRIVDTNIAIPTLDFAGVPLREALTALTRAYQLSFYLDTSITGSITMRLENVSLNDALLFIIKEHNLTWEKTGGIVKVFRSPPAPPTPPPINLEYDGQNLSLDISGVNLKRLVDTLIAVTGKNLVIAEGVRGQVTGKLVNLEFEKAFQTLLASNGYSLGKIDGIYHIGQLEPGEDKKAGLSRRMVKCEAGHISLDVRNAPLSEIINSISDQCGTNIVVYGRVEGAVSVSYSGESLERLLGLALKGTPYSFKREGDVYFIGEKTSENLYTSKLIKLVHIGNNTVIDLIPTALSKQVTVKAVKEQNGVIVTGPTTSVMEVETFLKEIDIRPAQVLFDAVVVDYNLTDIKEFNLTADNSGPKTPMPTHIYYPNIDYSATGDRLNFHLDNIADYLNIKNIGHLSSDFYLRLKIMEEQGIANIRSRPQIAALNGYSASIKIGTSQYYLLESKTIYPSEQTNVSTQTTQRFEVIEADMSLEVTPWVTQSGEIIVEIKPEFNSPATAFDPDIPPTINRRVLKSTVRLRNGETIVLGGMIQNHDNIKIKKFPILGSLPIIGRIFQNRSSTKIKSELMVYLTPHVYYGSEGSVDIEKILKEKK
ncbi:MAG: hypothetical protein HRF51_01605 [bacterium]|jgi:type IV pilus assembly protein PilQ